MPIWQGFSQIKDLHVGRGRRGILVTGYRMKIGFLPLWDKNIFYPYGIEKRKDFYKYREERKVYLPVWGRLL